MSIMGMREWFQSHRYVVLAIFGLLLLGLLGAYGQFGSSATTEISAEQYEAAIDEVLAAHEADPENAETAYMVAAYYAQYSSYLDTKLLDVDEEDENYEADSAYADEIFSNAAKYYGVYYGILADQYKVTLEEDRTYTNAEIVASYLQQQANMQLELADQDAYDALYAEAVEYYVISTDIQLEDVQALLAEDATNSENLATQADIYVQRAIYYTEQGDDTGAAIAYGVALDGYQAAYDNAGEDVEAAIKAMYLVYVGSLMEELEMEDAYGKYVAALALAPSDYDVVMAMASYLVSAMEYEVAKDLIVELQADYEEDSDEYTSIQSSVEYLDSMIEMMSGITIEGDGEVNIETEVEETEE